MLCENGDLGDLDRQGLVGQVKEDGTRVVIKKEQGEVILQNRKGVNYTKRLPELVAEAKSIPEHTFTIDGECVYINPKTGRTEFTGQQRRCATHFPDYMLRMQFPVTLKAYDLLKLNGEDLTDKPWHIRDEALKGLLKGRQTIQWLPHRTDLRRFFEEVKQNQEEGLILKVVDSRYEYERSYNWLKVKNWRFETCSVVGFTPGKNSRKGLFGALVLAKNGKLFGCAGSGFNDWELRQVKDILSDAPPMEYPFYMKKDYTAVKTNLKVKVKYYQLTEENSVMRFPVFVEVIK